MKKVKKGTETIVGIGSVLVDILIHGDDEFLKGCGAVKGGMIYVDKENIDKVIEMAPSTPVHIPGGSACNTIMGICRLGGKGKFIGKSGKDQLAGLFESHLIKNNVVPHIIKADLPTGRVLSVITPDAQRSMLTFLGASAGIEAGDIDPKWFDDTAIVHIEGYLVFNKKLVEYLMDAAEKSDALVSIDLASFNVVEQSKDFLHEITEKYVDILIANEDEARAFTGFDDEKEAVRAMAAKGCLSVVKLGEKGSIIAKDDEIFTVKPAGSSGIVDTTGAGDLWASGFFYGLVNDFPLDICGKMGSVCGYEVCKVIGAKIPDQTWEKIKINFDDIKKKI